MTQHAGYRGGTDLTPPSGLAALGDGHLAAMVDIDTTVSHASRVYDYLLGGVTNFAVDRRAVEYAN